MAPATKAVVVLTAEQRLALAKPIRTGTHAAHARTRAAVLSKADAAGPDGWPDERIAAALGLCRMTVARVRQQFAAEGLDATPYKKKAAGRQYRKLDGDREARLVTLAGSVPPAGRVRWTMKLLADRLAELEVVASIDPAAVWRTLKKTPSSRGSSSNGSSRRGRPRRSSRRWKM